VIIAGATCLLAGCGGSGAAKPVVDSIGPTKQCLRKDGQILPPKSSDFVASTAPAGAFRLKLRDNEVTVLFGDSVDDATGLANGYRHFRGKNVGIEDILRQQDNVVALWHAHPSDADLTVLADCLK
jgi:hypothetical protein